MINIEEIQGQIDSLQRCVDNYKGAIIMRQDVDKSPFSTYADDARAENLLSKTRHTLIGQLKLMNIQNEKLLNS